MSKWFSWILLAWLVAAPSLGADGEQGAGVGLGMLLKGLFSLPGEPGLGPSSSPSHGPGSMWRLSLGCCLSLGQGQTDQILVHFRGVGFLALGDEGAYTAHITHIWWAVTLVCCTLSVPLLLCFNSKSVWEQGSYWFHLSSHLSNLDTMDSRGNKKRGDSFAESLMQGVRWKSVVSHYTSQSRDVTL